MPRIRRASASVLAAGAICIGLVPAAWASPTPPTNGGNGAGQSGQCTGPQDDHTGLLPEPGRSGQPAVDKHQLVVGGAEAPSGGIAEPSACSASSVRARSAPWTGWLIARGAPV